MIVEDKLIPAAVGMMSLVGVGKQRPCGWGNYFSFATSREDVFADRGIRCLNMWAENLSEARNRFFDDGMVKVRLYTDEPTERRWAIVIDERLPSNDWLYNNLCFTGGYRPTLEIAQDIFQLLGDPENELEWWTDNEMYYARRGQKVKGHVVFWNHGVEGQKVLDDLIAKRASEGKV